jgi:hypothetical protein
MVGRAPPPPCSLRSHGPPPPLRFTARGRISEFILAAHSASRHSGSPRGGESRIHNHHLRRTFSLPDRDYGFRARTYGAPRNDKLQHSRDAEASECCEPPSDEAKRANLFHTGNDSFRLASGSARDPEKCTCGFRTRSRANKKGKRSAERRIVQSISASSAAARCSPCGAPAFRRSRLRHSPPVPPDGSAPEPGFPRRRLTGVLPASRKRYRG